MKRLIACIDKIKTFKTIETRFFYLNEESKEIKDVTLDLIYGIEKYNENKIASGQKYSLIPYEYKGGIIEYPHGCGLTHYLQNETLKELKEVYDFNFPIEECEINAFVPDDIENILGCLGAFDTEIEKRLIKRYC